MAGWLIWAVAIWFVFNIMSRRGCGWRGSRLHRIRGADQSRGGRSRPQRIRSSRSRATSRAPARSKETAEERIRRRFVEGRIDLDQYEAELWEELRPK